MIFTGCGAFKARLHTATTETTLSAYGAPGSTCEAFPFDRTFTFDELTGDAAKELGEGRKLCDFKWHVVLSLPAEAPVIADPSCAGPAGSVVLERVKLEYANEDGVTQRIEKECNTRLLFDSTQAQDDAVNNASLCLTSALNEHLDDVKKAFSVKSKKLRIAIDASCAPDACFSAEWTLKTVVTDGGGVIGDCPKQ